MIENHNICDFRVFDEKFEPFNYLGHRDKQVLRQCIQNFSVVVGLARAQFSATRVLETGAGLSTVIFSKLLHSSGEKIKTIDAFALDAIRTNSRGMAASFKLSEMNNCEVVKGITIDVEELTQFYQSKESTILSLSPEQVLSNIDLFLDINMEDRNYHKINTIINSNYITSSIVKNYFLKNSLFSNPLIDSYHNENDEFNFLKRSDSNPVLRHLLKQWTPNVIYLDSGEFSSVIEFSIIDELAMEGSYLIIQDIFFPKSIKSFMISSAIMASDRWKVLWIDRTTPQGMLVCRKER